MLTKLEGVEVEVERCGHCDKHPSKEEIAEAVKRAQKDRANARFRCSYCGETIKATKYQMWHDDKRWVAREKEVEPSLSIPMIHRSRRLSICDNNHLHARCVKKSMPFINGFDE